MEEIEKHLPGKYLNDVQTFGNWKISFRIYFDMEIDNTMRLVDDGNFDHNDGHMCYLCHSVLNRG